MEAPPDLLPAVNYYCVLTTENRAENNQILGIFASHFRPGTVYTVDHAYPKLARSEPSIIRTEFHAQ